MNLSHPPDSDWSQEVGWFAKVVNYMTSLTSCQLKAKTSREDLVTPHPVRSNLNQDSTEFWTIKTWINTKCIYISATLAECMCLIHFEIYQPQSALSIFHNFHTNPPTDASTQLRLELWPNFRQARDVSPLIEFCIVSNHLYKDSCPRRVIAKKATLGITMLPTAFRRAFAESVDDCDSHLAKGGLELTCHGRWGHPFTSVMSASLIPWHGY